MDKTPPPAGRGRGTGAALAITLVLALLLAFAPLPGPAGADPADDDARAGGAPRQDAGEAGGTFSALSEGFDARFGSGDSTPEIASVPEDASYARIAAKRRMGLRLLHGYATGIAPRPALAAYVDDVLARLIAHLPVRELPAKAYIMGSDRFSAAALPCGAIAVDWGLLHRLESEDELAFVLAHELAHIVYRHHDSDWFVEAQHFAVTSGEIGGTALDRLGRALDRTIDRGGGLAEAVTYGRIAYRVSEQVLMPAWQREQEDRADRFGMDLMVRAGYNAAAVLRFFAKLEAWEKAIAAGETDDPVAALVARADLGPHSLARPETAISAALDAADEIALDLFGGPDHYPAAERAGTLQDYYIEHYRDARLEPARPLPWAAPPPNGRLGEIDRRYALAESAYGALAEDRLAAAESAISRAVTRPNFWSDGYLRLAFYELRMRQGRRDAAVANLDYALEADRPGVQLFKARIAMAERAGDLARAVAVLDDARRRLDDPPALLPERIRLYPKVGRGDEIPPVLMECRLRWRDMADACIEAAARSRL